MCLQRMNLDIQRIIQKNQLKLRSARLSIKEVICNNFYQELERRLSTGKCKRHELIDAHGQTLLMYCIRACKPQCALVCVKHLRVLLNRKELANRGSTALHLAVKKSYYNLVCALVRAGAKKDIRDAEGHTPLSLAAGPERNLIRDFLIGTWLVRKWSPAVHRGSPMEFHREAVTMAQINWKKKWLSKDMFYLLMETLLELHRREHARKPSLYITASPLGKKPKCAAMTKKGRRCKNLVAPHQVDKCHRHS